MILFDELFCSIVNVTVNHSRSDLGFKFIPCINLQLIGLDHDSLDFGPTRYGSVIICHWQKEQDLDP
jgi:hypothetical protein